MSDNANAIERARKSVQGVGLLCSELRKFMADNDLCPASGGAADRERAAYRIPPFAFNANARAALALATALDHGIALHGVLFHEGSVVFSPWTLCRAILEGCARVLWLVDPSADVEKRVGRWLSLEYSSSVEHTKAIAAIAPRSERHLESERNLIRLHERLDADGFKTIRNKKSRVIGVGESLPGITSLIKLTLDDEPAYRLFSGVAHGEHYALVTVGIDIQRSEGDTDLGLIQLNPASVMLVCKAAADANAKAAKALVSHFGWDIDRFVTIVNPTLALIGSE